MADLIRMNRIVKEQKEGKIRIVTEQEESMTLDEFNDHYIKTYQDMEKLKVEFNILRAKIERLDKIESTPELEEFVKKLKDVEQIKEKNECIEIAKKYEKTISALEKDLIRLRMIQKEIKNEKEN